MALQSFLPSPVTTDGDLVAVAVFREQPGLAPTASLIVGNWMLGVATLQRHACCYLVIIIIVIIAVVIIMIISVLGGATLTTLSEMRSTI